MYFLMIGKCQVAGTILLAAYPAFPFASKHALSTDPSVHVYRATVAHSCWASKLSGNMPCTLSSTVLLEMYFIFVWNLVQQFVTHYC